MAVSNGAAAGRGVVNSLLVIWYTNSLIVGIKSSQFLAAELGTGVLR
jgi:hypothetical protein